MSGNPLFLKHINKKSVHKTRKWKEENGALSVEVYNVNPKMGEGWSIVSNRLGEYEPATGKEFIEYNKNKK